MPEHDAMAEHDAGDPLPSACRGETVRVEPRVVLGEHALRFTFQVLIEERRRVERHQLGVAVQRRIEDDVLAVVVFLGIGPGDAVGVLRLVLVIDADRELERDDPGRALRGFLDLDRDTAGEREGGALTKSKAALDFGIYASSVDSVRANFQEWRNQRIIAGTVPETLGEVDTDAVAFLHIDMNCAPPEVAALRHFWPRLSPGAFVLLDDYANRGRDEQRVAMDSLADELGVSVCALPTGQGLIIKPAC